MRNILEGHGRERHSTVLVPVGFCWGVLRLHTLLQPQTQKSVATYTPAVAAAMASGLGSSTAPPATSSPPEGLAPMPADPPFALPAANARLLARSLCSRRFSRASQMLTELMRRLRPRFAITLARCRWPAASGTREVEEKKKGNVARSNRKLLSSSLPRVPASPRARCRPAARLRVDLMLSEPESAPPGNDEAAGTPREALSKCDGSRVFREFTEHVPRLTGKLLAMVHPLRQKRSSAQQRPRSSR